MALAEEFDRALAAQAEAAAEVVRQKRADGVTAMQLKPLVRAQFREAAELLAARAVPITRHYDTSLGGLFGNKVRVKNEIFGWSFGGNLLLGDGRLLHVQRPYFGVDHRRLAPKQYDRLEYFEVPINPGLFRMSDAGTLEVQVSRPQMGDEWTPLEPWIVAHMAEASGAASNTPYMKWVGREAPS